MPMPLLAADAASLPAPALGWAAPFALLLLAIAVLPLVAHHWWERNRNRALVAGILAVPAVLWALANDPGGLGHAAEEYLSFCLMLGCLYVVAGGLVLEGDLPATPRVNATFLAVGALLANLVGTTGAAMLLVRPLLRTNARRKRVVHTFVFFIVVVCNTGGCLTPLADPPLYLGYLLGVPFAWTLRLLPYWLAMNGALLAIYYVWDRRAYRREAPADVAFEPKGRAALGLAGKANLLALAGVVALVALRTPSPFLELGLAALAIVSFTATPRSLHERNGFSWTPIVEVAILFAGIFATMVPALGILRARGPGLGIETPGAFFWATGALSGLLDNAPTYVMFLSVAQSLGLGTEVVGTSHAILVGISLGAVFMGANTYVGNGPNFMVRAIAESQGVRMPSFFGYMRYTALVLVPLYVVLWAVVFA